MPFGETACVGANTRGFDFASADDLVRHQALRDPHRADFAGFDRITGYRKTHLSQAGVAYRILLRTGKLRAMCSQVGRQAHLLFFWQDLSW